MPNPIVIASIDIRYRPTPKGNFIIQNFPRALCVGNTLQEMHKHPTNITHAMKYRGSKVRKWVKIPYYDAQIISCESGEQISMTNV